jgi:hypothetical protein
MARRRRRAKARTITRYVKKKAKRYGRKATSLTKPVQIDSMIYGGLRAKVSNAISPFTSKIPLGDISDELGMGLLNYMVAKKSSGMIKNIAMKGLVIENARVGEAIATQGVGLLSGAGTTAGQNNLFVGGY